VAADVGLARLAVLPVPVEDVAAQPAAAVVVVMEGVAQLRQHRLRRHKLSLLWI
jgi:hypothetical protein